MGNWRTFGVNLAQNTISGGASMALNAGGQVVNGLINQAFAEHNRQREFYYNEKAADAADARQRAQYEDLYSPSAMISQYEDAGLSPSMMFGKGAGVVGGNAQGQNGGGVSGAYPALGGLDPLTIAQIENIKADTKLKEKDAGNVEKDTDLKGQQIINLMAQEGLYRAQSRLVDAQADLLDIQIATDEITMQAKIQEAYANAEKAVSQSRSALNKAELDEALFDCSFQLAYANLNNTLTDTQLKNANINVSIAQIKEIAERIRNSQWETWATEKEQNRKDAIFKLDKQKFKAEVEMWAKEQNIKLAIAEIEMVSDLVGYVVNFATCGLASATQLKQTEMYTQTRREIANKPKTTHTQYYRINKKGQKEITSGKYSKTD